MMTSSRREKKKSFHLAGRTISAGAYQNAVTMGTHSGSEPLVGLELHLSVYVIYMKILIACRRKKGGKETNFRANLCSYTEIFSNPPPSPDRVL